MPEPTPGVAAIPPLPEGLDPHVARWLELGEAHAMRDTHAGASAIGGNPMGFGQTEIAGATASSMAAIDYFFFNRVVGLGVERPVTREDVDTIVAYYRGIGITKDAVQPANGAQPPELATWLAEAGYVAGGRWVKLWHDLAGLDPVAGDRRIELIGPEEAGLYGDIVLEAFEMPEPSRPLAVGVLGMPGWLVYLGYEDGRPVAAAATRIEDGVAWLGFGSTLPDFRGRGWQTAMFLRRLHDAKAAGCHLAVTETGEETEQNPVNHSYRNMVRTGFRLAYARRNWYRP